MGRRRPAAPEGHMIVITIEGGLVQGVSSDDPRLVGEAVAVIDYDAEGADPEEVHQVPQGDGDAEEAVIGFREVGAVYGPVGEFVRNVLRKESGEDEASLQGLHDGAGAGACTGLQARPPAQAHGPDADG